MFRTGLRCVVAGAALVAGCGGGGVGAVEATASTPASASITVRRDAHGVPYVASETDLGAMFGLGWVSACDRFVQMNLHVRTAQGRMAELRGGAWLESDRRHRILGTWRHAQRVADALPPEPRAMLAAYSDGVNAWFAQDGAQVPDLLTELGSAPELWTPAHSIAAWWRFAELFTPAFEKKAERYYDFQALLASGLTVAEAVEAFLGEPHPGQPDAAVVRAEDVPARLRAAIDAYAGALGYGPLAEICTRLGALHPSDYGHESPKFSHAWALSGAHTKSGAALLVSDPQVPVFFPNLFYEWHVAGKTFRARGVGIPGCPGLLVGFGAELAWGVTAAGLDHRDLFRLEMTGADTYVVDGVEHTFETTKEWIQVKDASPVAVTHRDSVFGPVVTDLLPAVDPGPVAPGSLPPQHDDEFALLGVPYDDPAHHTFEALLAMMRCRSVGQLQKATGAWRTPSLNLVAADANGDVFYTLVGAIPVRSSASPLGGVIAQEGTSLANGWADLVPAVYHPWVVNPSRGYIASANHRVEDGWYPIPLGLGTGAHGHTTRSRRLSELLEAVPSNPSPEEFLQTTQYDCRDCSRRDIVRILRHVRDHPQGTFALSSETLAALSELEPWSDAGGSMLADQPGVFLASRIATKFRPSDTGPVLQELYGTAENGLNLFLAATTALVDLDPEHVVEPEAVAFLDGVLRGAWERALADGGPVPSAWDAQYAAEPNADPTLAWLANSTALGEDFDSAVVYDAPALRCPDQQTIWSQRNQSYTQFVDLGDVDSARSLLAPGDAETPGAAALLSGAEWANGVLKAAPLTEAAVEAATQIVWELSYTR